MATITVISEKHVQIFKASVFIVIITLAAVFVYFRYTSQQSPSANGDGTDLNTKVHSVDLPAQPVAKVPSEALILQKDIENTEAKNPSQSTDPWHSRANFEEVEKWKEGRGYYSDADLQTYKNYSPETIEQLAKTGDIKAIYALADLKIDAGASQQEIVNTYLDAAVLGSSQALDWAAGMARTDRSLSKFDRPDGDELYKKEMLEALSIYQVALIRGDREVMERVNETRAQIKFTLDDEKYIEQRGAEIYSDLERRRISMGLGPFDNSVPEIVRNYHKEAETGFRKFINRQ